MPVLLYTLSWMTYNVFLAILPVIFAHLFRGSKKTIYRLCFFSLWLVFLPNTLYLLTDLIHLRDDMTYLSSVQYGVLLGMYALLILIGCVTYILACLPFFMLTSSKKRHRTIVMLFVLNFFMGIGIVLGRIFRFNSWDLLLHPVGVFHVSKQIITTSTYISLVVLFAVMSTLLYVTAISWYKALSKNSSK